MPISFVYYHFPKLLVISLNILTLLKKEKEKKKRLVGLRLASPKAKTALVMPLYAQL